MTSPSQAQDKGVRDKGVGSLITALTTKNPAGQVKFAVRLILAATINCATARSSCVIAKEGKRLDADHLPKWMQTTEMRQAMSTLKRFSDKERAYHAYQARQNYLRMQGSIAHRQQELEEALAEEREAALHEVEAKRQAIEAALQDKEAERQAKEAALQEKEAALARIARLEAQLRADHSQGEG